MHIRCIGTGNTTALRRRIVAANQMGCDPRIEEDSEQRRGLAFGNSIKALLPYIIRSVLLSFKNPFLGNE